MPTSKPEGEIKGIAELSREQRALLIRRLQEKANKRGVQESHTLDIQPVPRDRPLPLSFAQQRLWFLAQLERDTPIYYVPIAVGITEPLDVAAFHQSLNDIVRRHEVLRTTFATVDRQPVQVIAPRLALPLPLFDLQGLTKDEREVLVARLTAEESMRLFDLARGPLLRTILLRLGPADHVLLFTQHHIISDGWSTPIFIRELHTFYMAACTGRPAALPNLPIQYADYAAWQRSRLQGEVLEEQLVYWRRQLADLPTLDLPTDQLRPAVPTFRGAYQGLALDPALSDRLAALSRREDVTLFMLLLAVFQTLLQSYTGQNDIIVGTDVANRIHAKTEGLIGFFVNQLVLRTDLSGDPTVAELLGRVRTVCLGAYAHQDLPFEQLVAEIQPDRHLNRTPLFQVKLILQNARTQLAGQPASTLRLLPIAHTTAQFDLLLDIEETAHGIVGTLVYSTDLFEAPTIERMLGHFQNLLEGMVANAARRVSDLPLLGEAERHQLLVEWNTAWTGVRSQESGVRSAALCVHHLFAAQAVRTPDAIAVVFDRPPTTDQRPTTADQRPATSEQTRRQGDRETGRSGDRETGHIATPQSPIPSPQSLIPNTQHPTPNTRQLTYDELNRRTNQLAHHLRQLGVGPDVLVAVCMERSTELVVALLGVLKAGGAYLPLDPTYPTERLAFMLEDSQAPILLTQARLVDELPTHWALVVRLDSDWEAIAQQSEAPPDSAVQLAHLAYVIYTSGSTGQPKGVQVAHHGLGNLAAGQIAAFAVRPESHVLQFASFSFDAAVSELWMALLGGATLHLAPRSALLPGPDLLGLLRTHAISHVTLPPSALAALPPTALPALRTLIVAGEACPAALIRAWAPGRRFVNAYGPTEATVCTTLTICASDQHAAAIGRPIANAQVYVLNARQQPVPLGVTGELYIGGAGLARGYLHRPDLTAAAFIPNPFGGVLGVGCWVLEDSAPNTQHPTPNTRLYRTGDLVRYRADGALEFVGRRDAQIKLRGFRIELGEVEAVLQQHPAVREAVVVVREDTAGDKRLVAYIVPKIEDRGLKIEDSGSDAREPLSSILYPLSSELRSFLQTKLPDYMIPAAFVLLDALPLTSNGKIDRKALPAPEPARLTPDDGFVAPRTPIEELLATIWAAVLHRDRVGIHDNFFQLGGHSLLVTQLIARIAETFQVELPFRDVFEAPTVQGLAARIAAVRQASTIRVIPPLRPVPRDGPLPLSYAQQRLWFLDQVQPDSPIYNLPTAVRLVGALDVAVFEQSLNEIVRRHEALRTSFPMSDGQPIQVIHQARRMRLPLLDLQDLPEHERETTALLLAAEEAQLPFDLARGPLLRVTLLRLGEAEHVLLLTMHHTISDAWSMGVFIREIGALYTAFSNRQPSPLPELPIQYADYAVWQRQWLQGPGDGRQGDKETRRQGDKEIDVDERSTQNSKLKTQNSPLEEQLAYWRQHLADLPVLELPTDHPRPPVPTSQGIQQSFGLPPALSGELVVLSRRKGVTLFMALLAAWQVLLARYSDQDDIVVGTPITNRNRLETEGLIGFFLNTLVLRVDLSGNPSFQEVLPRVREVCLDAYAHQDVPFEQVVGALQPARDLSRHPLFQVMFVLQNAPLHVLPAGVPEFPNLQIQPLEMDRAPVKFDLSLTLVETGAGLTGVLEYTIDLFEAATIARMAGHLQTLLEGIVDQPERCLADLPLMNEAERRQLLVGWNATEPGVRGQGSGIRSERSDSWLLHSDSWCVHQLFAAQAARTPDAIALVFDRPTTNDHYRDKETRRQGDKETGDDEASTQNSKLKTQNYPNTQHPTPNTRQLTYGELNARANQLAHYLRARGVGPEVRVALCLDRSLELVVALLGILKAGGAYVPLDPAYPPERLAFMLADAQPAVLITTTDHRPPTTDHRPPTTDHRPPTDDHPITPSPLHPFTPSPCHLVTLSGSWPAIAQHAPSNPVASLAPDTLAYLIYTSGTTGRPKAVMVAQRQLVATLRATQQLFSLHSTDVMPWIAAVTFDIALFELFTPLLAGARVQLLTLDDVLTRPRLLATLQQVTCIHMVPSLMRQVVQAIQAAGQPASRYDQLRQVFVGGEVIPPALLDALRHCFRRAQLWAMYGPTEGTIISSAYALPPGPAPTRPLMGRPLAPVQVQLYDARQRLVPIGVPGEVYLGGAGVTRGYLNRPDLTAERFIPNPFLKIEDRRLKIEDSGLAAHESLSSIFYPLSSESDRLYKTGDRARYRADGVLEYLGRIDDQVKIRGFRIELGEIEAVLAQYADVHECALVAQEDAAGEQRLVAYVVPTNDQRPTTNDQHDEPDQSSFVVRRSSFVEELRSFLQTYLPDYMLPSAIVFLDALPLTSHGKLDRRALPAPDIERPNLDVAFITPRTPVEATLAHIWGNLLGLDKVGIHDNFFTLGGDSILIIQVIARAHQAGLQLTPRQMFQHQTIAELAAVAGSALTSIAEQGLVIGAVPLTPIQHFFFASELPEPHHFNQALLFAVRQPLGAALLEQALRHLLRHHDALRLRFVQTAAGWQQHNAGAETHSVFTLVDLSALPAVEQGAAIEAAAAALQTSLDLAMGPLLRAALFDCGAAQPSRLLLIIHHLLVDGISWRILLEDLQTTYTQLGQGEVVQLPPKTTSFQQWAVRLQEYAGSDALRAELDYWLAAKRRPVRRLPVDQPGGANTVASARSVAVVLSAVETRALVQDIPAVYHTQINDLLLTALVQALAPWSGSSTLLVDLEGHGREPLFDDLDLSRTVGWYTTIFPVYLDLREAAGPGEALKLVKEQLRGIPNRGIGYGLLRYLSAASSGASLQTLPAAEVSFNYLGRVDQAISEAGLFGPAPEASGPAQHPGGPRSHLLEINSLIAADQLRLEWTYSDQLHQYATITRLAEAYLAALRALIAHCRSPEAGGYTPSDFPLARLGQPALDRLFGLDRQLEDIYPLSPMQQGMLFHTLHSPKAGMYVEQLCCTLQGELDSYAFRHAWQQVVARHAILRTVFVWEGLDQPLQIVRAQVQLPWDSADWRPLTSTEQQERLAAYLTQGYQQGFDLSCAPLMRLALFQVADDAYRFVWSHHHLLLDGWSLPLVLNEVMACYAAFVQNQEVQLERPRPYRDYIAWLQRQDLAQAEVFWKELLAGFTTATPLAIDHRSEPESDDEQQYAEQQLQIDIATTTALQELARRQGLTLNTLTQGAWAVLLSCYSGETDVVFGVTLAGRPPDLAGVETMVGVFINTLPVRVRVRPETPLLEWLRQVQAQQAELRQYEYSPLVQVQSWSAVPGGIALFESIVVFENYPTNTSIQAQGERVPLEIRDVDGRERTNYPLTVVIAPEANMTVRIGYDCRRFDAATIARMLGHLRTLLEGVVAQPEQRLAGLSLLSDAERHQLLVTWNATATAYPKDLCIHTLFEAQVQRRPDAVAVVFDGRTTTDHRPPTTDRRLPLHPFTSSPLHTFTCQHLTYYELNRRANQLAHRLRRMGVGPEVLVALCLERSLDLVIALLSVLKAGGAYVPLDPSYPKERLAFMLADTRAPVLLTQERLVEHLPQPTNDQRPTTKAETRRQGDKETRKAEIAPSPIPHPSPPPALRLSPIPHPAVICLDTGWQDIASAHQANPVGDMTSDHLAYVSYTSGSTGTPKGVSIIHRSVVRLVQATNYATLGAEETFLQLAPIAFDASTFEIWGCLLNGARLVVFPARTPAPEEVGRILQQYQVSTLWLTAGLFHLMVDQRLADFRPVRQLLAGGDVLSAAHVRKVLQKFATCRVINGYGPTENTTFTSCHPMTHPDQVGTSVPIGRPIANTQIYLLDRQYQPVPIGVPGELYTGGDGLARGYLHRPDLTAERFIPNPFPWGMGDGGWGMVASPPSPIPHPPSPGTRLYRTGDLARYRPDGTLEYLGRLDRQIKLRGFRVELQEIEAVLQQHPAVHEVVAVTREDAPGEKRLVAYVVPKIEDRGLKIEDSGSDAPDPLSSILYPLSSELRSFLQTRLPDYMIPAAFVVLDRVPLTPNGKLDRAALPAPESYRTILDGAFAAPATPIEELLAQIWADVLHLERVGIHDNFFELGGHSLMATQVMSRLRTTFHVDLPLRCLFETPTLAELAVQIEQAQYARTTKVRPALVPVGRARALPLSFAQQRLWFLDQLEPNSAVYNIPIAVSLGGPLQVAALEQSLCAILRRHEALRTTFAAVEGQPMQVIAPVQPMALPLIDLEGLPDDAQTAVVRRLVALEARRPFDLTRGPLLRATLLRLDDAEHVALLTMHHIVSDGWSMGVLVREIGTLYRALAAGSKAQLPELPIQYADYAVWQRMWLQGEVLDEHLAYWKEQLADLPVLELPTDHLRPAVETYQGTSQYGTLAPALSAGLHALSRAEGVTPFMMLLAAFQVVLARYSGQDDIVVGTPIANRTRAEIEPLIGFFVNTLVLRTDLSGNPSFQELLTRVREVCLGAYAHQDLPFEMLVDALAPARNLSRAPLFQVMIVLQNLPLPSLELSELTLRPLETQIATAKFDLTLDVTDSEHGMLVRLEHNTDLFDPATITRMLGHFQTLLESIVAAPAQAIASLPLLTATERQQILVEWNATQTEFRSQESGVRSKRADSTLLTSDSCCLHLLIEAQAARTPDVVAVVFDNRPTTNDQRPTTNDQRSFTPSPLHPFTPLPLQQLTYHELNVRANRLAHHLRALGVSPELVVAVCMERSLALLVALLGVLKAGAAYLPLDPSYPTERLAFMLEDAQAAVLITMTGQGDTETRRQGDKETSSADSVTPSPLHSLTVSQPVIVDLRADWPSIAAAPPSNPACPATPDNLAYVIYTSGSTGKPKGALNTHRAIINRLLWMQDTYRLQPDDRVLHKTPISFDVSVWELCWPLLRGACLVLARVGGQQDPHYLAELLAHERITTLHFVPPMLQVFLELPELAGCSSLRRVICSGEALPLVLQQRFFTRLTAELHNLYGPTEAAIDVSAWACIQEAEPRSVPIGRPIANTQLYLLDRHLQPLPVGVAGELYIGGVQLARGYLRRPDLTAERFVPNPFAGVTGDGCWVTGDESSNTQHPTPNTRLYRTGDLARYRADGAIEFIGRTDEQVKVRGNRVELGEVAAVLSQHAAVREAAVLARTEGGRVRLVAYVVLRTEGRGLSGADSSVLSPQSSVLSELRAFLQTKLPDYMLPAAFVLLEALPLTANGKLDRRALPSLEQARTTPEDAYVAPRTAVEELLAQIWAAVLRRERVGVHENFFALGGDSILSIQIVARANQAGVYLTPRQLFQHQTIAALAAVADTAPTRMIAQELVVGPTPLTPIQRRFFSQQMLEPHHYNQSVLLMAHQPLDAALLDLAVEHLLRHHDALRLRFAQAEDGWHQRQTALETQTVGLQIDLSALPDTMQRIAIETAAATLQASLDLTDGPIMRVAHFVCGAGQPDRLLMIIHHLAVDGVSWRILLEDLQTAYAQLSRGAAVQLPPKTSAFQQWAERLLAYAQSAALRDELAYWLAPRRRGVGRLPLDNPTGANTLESARNVVVSLNAEQTHLLLQDVPAVYRTQINDVLLTALAQTLTAWTGADAVQIELEGHGREELFADVDLTRTVGWFTTLFPVLLDLAGSDGPAAALKTIKEQLRAVPNRGIGYGVLRYLTADPAMRAQAPAEVVFNYLGQVDQVLSETSLFGPADESRGPEQSPRGMRGHLLEINGVVAGGQLHLSWTYSAALHQHAMIARLAQDYLAALLALIAHCRSPQAGGATPSDFPLAQLDQATLDRLVGADRQIEDLYPLAPMQAGMLFHTLHSPESGVYVEQLSCTFHGNLDLAAFQRAWQVLVERHAILRTAFIWEGLDRPIQVVYAQLRLPWVLDDWRALGAADQQARLEAYLSHTRRHGFELAQAPLMRLALFQVADDVHQFVWTWHHILMDGWSASIIMQELFGAYVALAQGGMVPFGPPPRYRDYIAWLQQQDPGRAEQFWRHYLQGLNAPTPLGVGHAVEAGRQTSHVAEHHGVLPSTQTAALGVLTRRHGITLNIVLQGAWALLLSRYSGEADVVFGATVAGRPPELAGVERMVGLFINTLPVRVQMAPQSLVPAWLHDLHTQQVELRQYEYTPLIQIQGWSAVPRGLPMFESILIFENYPLAEATHAQEHSPQLAIDNVRSVEQTNYPIALIAAPGPVLALTISYDAQRFDRTTIERMLSHLQVLLEGMAADHGQRLAELPLLTAGERQQLLVEWNASDRGVRGQGSGVRSEHSDSWLLIPDSGCIHELFAAQAARTPNAIAVVFDGPPTTDHRPPTTDQRSPLHPFTPSPLHPFTCQHLTYAELDRRANRLARHLRGLGVGPEALVGICLERSPELIVGLLGVLKAGGAYMPLDPAYPAERLKFMLDDAQASVLITMSGALDRETRRHGDTETESAHDVTPSPLHLVTLSQRAVVDLHADWPVIAQASPVAPCRATPDNLVYVIYTSGSTGTPKGVMVQHHSLVNLARAAADLIDLRLGQRMLQFASFSFDASALQIFPTLISGATLVLHSDPAHLTNHELLEVCARQQVTVLDLPAAFWQQWVADLAARQVRPPSAIQVYMTGGERIPLERVEQWAGLASQPVRLLSSYGPTEATVTATLFATSSDQVGCLAMPNIPIGDHLPNIQIYLLDQHMQPVPIGVVGEVHIGGAGLARGYLNRPELTADRFVPNPFAGDKETRRQGDKETGDAAPATQNSKLKTQNLRLYRTGDLARYRLNGSLEFVGRRDTQVKLRGFRIEPGEVEAMLTQHPDVREAAVVAREDVPGNKRLVAYIVPKIEDRGLKIEDSHPGTSETLSSILYPLSSELRRFLQTKLPSSMVPSTFVVLDALPLTPHGKLDRQALPAPDQAASPTGDSYIPPRDGMELQLVQIWEDLLAARPIGVADDFFALGGHSLHAVALIARIQRQFGQSLPLATLFQEPTIQGLALRLRQQTGSHVYAPLVPIQPSGTKRPFFCVHPAAGNVLCYATLAHYLGPDQPLYGLQARGVEEDQEPFTRVEDMAAHYIAALQAVQPDGPYLLGGWSSGGVVAFEMAQQLHRQGQEVALLALLDTGVPQPDQADNPPSDGDILIGLLGPQLLPLPQDDFLRLAPDEQVSILLEAAKKANRVPPDTDLLQVQRLLKIFKANVLAVSRYNPEIYPHQITLFKSEQSMKDATTTMRDDLGAERTRDWAELSVKPILIYPVPGEHMRMLNEPHVRILAEKLQSCLDRHRAEM